MFFLLQLTGTDFLEFDKVGILIDSVLPKHKQNVLCILSAFCNFFTCIFLIIDE